LKFSLCDILNYTPKDRGITGLDFKAFATEIRLALQPSGAGKIALSPTSLTDEFYELYMRVNSSGKLALTEIISNWNVSKFTKFTKFLKDANFFNKISGNHKLISAWEMMLHRLLPDDILADIDLLDLLVSYNSSTIATKIVGWTNDIFSNHFIFFKNNTSAIPLFKNYVTNGILFVTRSGEELAEYLKVLKKKPSYATYSGPAYRSVKEVNVKTWGSHPLVMDDFTVNKADYRFSLKGTPGQYFSATLKGNQDELTAYPGAWTDYLTWEYPSVLMTEMLDLTNPAVRAELGVDFSLITRGTPDQIFNYEFTGRLGKWAFEEGYKGIITIGARVNKDYVNLILFYQDDIDRVFGAYKTLNPITK